MRIVKHCLFVALACGYSIPLHAAEGPSLAGPIGGTDIRSAVLPPPGLYGGGVALRGEVLDFVDGQGQPIPALNDANIKRTIVAPFIGYVPNINVLGGSIGFFAIVPYGKSCGHLFQANPKLCQSGFGDPYLETQWSRFFGVVRPPRSPGALPIMQGLSIELGFGVVVPSGQYNSTDPTTRALSAGSNIWDYAPHIAFTYTSAPILADGTENSAPRSIGTSTAQIPRRNIQQAISSILILPFQNGSEDSKPGSRVSMPFRWRTTRNLESQFRRTDSASRFSIWEACWLMTCPSLAQ
jgi:hypothetical protein